MTAADLFAGLGGFTLAATLAGVKVIWAANHWLAAVDIHAANHPGTSHVCQDLHQCDWESVPRMDLLLASPSCQGHAKARGKERPHHDKARSTAWAVVSCAEYHRPKAAIIENVPEFLNWDLFPAWKAAMEALGYAVSINVFDAADSGVPQNRVRCFVVAFRGKVPLIIAKPSAPMQSANSFIDWSSGRWAKVNRKGRATNTLVRYVHGQGTFGRRFLFSYYGNTRTSRSIDRPIGTITTRDRWAVVDGDHMRMLTPPELRRAMGFPDGYIIPTNSRLAVHMIGNAVPPALAAHVIREVRKAV